MDIAVPPAAGQVQTGQEFAQADSAAVFAASAYRVIHDAAVKFPSCIAVALFALCAMTFIATALLNAVERQPKDQAMEQRNRAIVLARHPSAR